MDKEKVVNEIRKKGSLRAYWENEHILTLDMDIRYYKYSDDFDELMRENGWDEKDLAQNVVMASLKDLAFCYNEEDIDSWRWVRHRLRLCCARKDYDNYAVQKSVVDREFLDTKLFVRILVNDNYMLEVPEDSLKKWKKSKEYIFEIAKNNSFKEIEISEIEPVNKENVPIYHMTTNGRRFGASVIVYEEKLAEMCDMLDSDIIVLPYSRDEVIIVPKEIMYLGDDGNTKIKNMCKIMKELHDDNNSVIQDAEFISENIYVFSREKNKMEIYSQER